MVASVRLFLIGFRSPNKVLDVSGHDRKVVLLGSTVIREGVGTTCHTSVFSEVRKRRVIKSKHWGMTDFWSVLTHARPYTLCLLV